jgi:hypothetical protein
MSAPALVKFPKLVVEITQREDVPNFEARVVQGNLRGDNLFEGVVPPVRRIERAHKIVHKKLDAAAAEIEFLNLAPNARGQRETSS